MEGSNGQRNQHPNGQQNVGSYAIAREPYSDKRKLGLYTPARERAWESTIQSSIRRTRIQKSRKVHGLDYDETFSPMTCFTSIRVLLQKAANDNLYLHQMDVKGAYLNAPIDKDIFLQQPPGYEQTKDDGSQLTCHLRKSIYGLKQSGGNWHKTLTDFLKSQESTPNQNDSCIYSHTSSDNNQLIILFWVGDISKAAKCLRALSGLFSPKLIDQSSCRILTTHVKTRPVLHDDW